MGAQAARSVESGNEWATPRFIVEHAAAKLGIGGFDLDPAATKENAKAAMFYDQTRNGLLWDWFGFVWLNPPFSRSLSPCSVDCFRVGCVKRGFHLPHGQQGAVDFAEKAVIELQAQRVEAIAWHGPVAPDTDWHAKLWPYVEARYEYSGRIRYNDSDGGGTFASHTMILRPWLRAEKAVPTYLVPGAPCEDHSLCPPDCAGAP